MKKNLLRKWNKGFTLVEVVIAIGIASLALLSIGGFMAVSARSFSSTSAEVNLQYESQLAYNQLQDLIVDAGLGITQASVVGGTETVIDADAMMDDSADQKTITIFNESDVYKIIWDNATDRLLYEEYDVAINALGEAVLGAARVTGALMAEYITDFDVDLSLLEAKQIVGIQMTYEKNNKSYDASYNITIRNQVAVNKSMAEAYVTPPPTPPANSIDPIPAILVEPGSVYTFPAPIVRSTSTAIPSQVVRWYIDTTDSADAGTTIDVNSGRLQVSSGESHDTFKVKVVTDDGSTSRLVDVNVRKVSNVGFDAGSYVGLTLDKEGNSVAANKLGKEDEFQLTATVTMNYEQELTTGATGHTLAEAKELEWEIKEGDTYLEAAASQPPENNKWEGKMKSVITTDMRLRVRATAKNSKLYAPTEGKYGEWEGTTYIKPSDFEIVIDSDFQRGQEYAFNIADQSPSTGYIYLFDIALRYKLYDEMGEFTGYQRVSNIEPFIDRGEGGNNLKIRFPSNLDPYTEYEIDMSCYKFYYPAQPGKITYGFLKDYSGYNIRDAVGQSWLDTMALKVSELYFDSGTGDPLTLVKYFSPRKYGERLNGTSEQNFMIGGITNFRMTDFNISRDSIKWNFYTNSSGGNYKNAFQYYASGNNCLNQMFTSDVGGTNLQLRFNRGRWNNNVDNIPKVLYLVPTINVGGTNYLMYHTYVKYINYNIEVNIDGTNQKLYFPYPGCEADGLTQFPGRYMSGNTSPTPGTWNNAYWNRFNNFQNLYYNLSRNVRASDGVVTYRLQLYSSSSRYESDKLGFYSIEEGQTDWTLIP